MAENKTVKTKVSVTQFLDQVKNDRRRADGKTLLKLMKKVTGKQPKMWGPSIIGFDEYHYKYESGREGDMCMIGFSPRSTALVIYVMSSFPGFQDLLKKLGKHKTSKACLYINKLADVDMEVLEQIIHGAYEFAKANKTS